MPSIPPKLPMLLAALRLPAIARLWPGHRPAIARLWPGCGPGSAPGFCARADKAGWPAARLLAAPAEPELAERERRRIQRHLVEARLPPGKTLDAFDFRAPLKIESFTFFGIARC